MNDRLRKNVNGLLTGERVLFLVLAILFFISILHFTSHDVHETLEGIPPWVIISVVILYVINLFTKAYRWHLLMGANGWGGPFLHTAKIFTVIMAINNLTPGSVGGEPLRIHLAKKEMGIPSGTTGASIVIEKSLDLMILSGYGILGLILAFPYINRYVYYTVLSILIALFLLWVMVFYMLFFRKKRREVGRFTKMTTEFVQKKIKINIIERLFHRSLKFSKEFSEGTFFYKKNVNFRYYTFILTLLIWANEVLRVYLFAQTIGLNAEIGRWDGALGAAVISCTAALILGAFIPGGVGHVFSITGVYLLFGINPSDSISLGILSTFTSIWICIPAGLLLILLSNSRMRLNRIE